MRCERDQVQAGEGQSGHIWRTGYERLYDGGVETA